MTNRKDNAIVEDMEQFSVLKTFHTNQKAFSEQT